MALVVVGHRATPTLLQRQSWLCPIQCLNLALLIDAQYQCLLRRIQIQTHHVGQLLHKLRIPRQLEGPAEVRLEVMQLPVGGQVEARGHTLICDYLTVILIPSTLITNQGVTPNHQITPLRGPYAVV